MKLNDKDLLAKLLSLPEHLRADFVDFFGMSNLSSTQIDDLEETLSASAAFKNRLKPGKAH